jgi:hypothetical protein
LISAAHRVLTLPRLEGGGQSLDSISEMKTSTSS